MGQDNNAELEMMIGFIDEAMDDLCSVVQNLMTLRSSGYDETTVQSLFRVFHSIKGNAAYFNLLEIKELSHAIEQVMEGMRQKTLPITDDIVELLIDGSNGVSKAFEVVRSKGASAKMPESVNAARDEILKFLESGSSGGDSAKTLEEIIEDLVFLQTEPGLLGDILTKYQERLERLTVKDKKDDVVHDEHMPAEYRELKGIMQDAKTYPVGDSIFARIRVLIETLRQHIKDSADSDKIIAEMLDNISICETTIGLDSLIKATVLEQMAGLAIATDDNKDGAQEHDESAGAAAEQPQAQAQAEQAGAAAAAAHAVTKTMRISEEAVDNFLAFVGELVIVEDMYVNVGTMAKQNKEIRKEELVVELKKITETFSLLSRNLQKSIMEIRKVPIDQIFKRMPKIVNEVAQKTGKHISVNIEGGDLRIDKTILETLESPLVHMVRNAADHGIEKPHERLAAGKDEEGVITLNAEEKAGIVTVIIQDDGAGLNLDRLRAKALELGIMREDESFDQEKIINVMFASGVSTAEEVTDISGRGVGMDVVRKNLEKASGAIATQTEHGKGTTFTITIPSVMTTQIMQGFVVKTETDRFILPLESIEASISVSEAKIQSVNETGNVLQFKDGVIPVQRLAEAVEPEGREFYTDEKDIIVVVYNKGIYRAFVVSAVVGIHQIVKKDLTLPKEFAENISGSAIMGDGIVSLLLNIDVLLGTDDGTDPKK